MEMLCPCNSAKSYALCCKMLHEGEEAQNALKLMRSRYSAYALQNTDYIIRTTHPESTQYNRDIVHWTKEILTFCRHTLFQKLEILAFMDGEKEAYVSFIAHLQQHNRPVKLIENSYFERMADQWLYRDGIANLEAE